jgi:DNA segregation ATPase FtsK/SpoIIIE-like protein
MLRAMAAENRRSDEELERSLREGAGLPDIDDDARDAILEAKQAEADANLEATKAKANPKGDNLKKIVKASLARRIKHPRQGEARFIAMKRLECDVGLRQLRTCRRTRPGAMSHEETHALQHCP